VSLDADWRFVREDVPAAREPGFDDSRWAPVTVPHTWNSADGQDGGANYWRGAGWYRRHYTPPAEFAGRKLWLEFGGANIVTDVWVDGTYLGAHRGGYARFRLDATGVLSPGRDAVIAVRVSNALNTGVAPLTADYTFFGGIYRDVNLVVTDALGVSMLDAGSSGVYLRQRAVSAVSATVDVTTRVWNGSRHARSVAVRVVLADAAGTVVARSTSRPLTVGPDAGRDATQTLTIGGPRLWQGRADPYLYRARVEVLDALTGLVADVVDQRLGLRTVAVDPARGLSLNGHHLALHGVNRHQDRPGRGWAVSPADEVADFDLMDEMGVNALRTAHYQQDQHVYDLADEGGYLVWAEIPVVNSSTGSEAFRANAAQQLRELIRQDFNHPSIAFWGIGNELAPDDPPTNSLLDTLAGIVHAEDPDRLSTYAHHGPVTSGLAGHTDVLGENWYGGWYYGSYAMVGPWLDDVHRRYPDRPLALSEYGAGASVVQHADSSGRPVPDSPWHPEEYQALFHEAYWAQLQARPYLWGTFVWNMFDFAADQRAEGDTAGRNDKGLVTYDRATRKDAFYFYKANWTSTPFVYLAGRRFVDRTDPVTTVKVYGNADRVVLKLNGVPVGPARTPADQHVYTWSDVRLSPGVNTVEVVGTHRGITYSDSVTWVLHTA
jgi:beta-galactosidase